MPAWGVLTTKGLAAVSKVVPVKPVVESAGKAAAEATARRRARRTQREHAERLARQVGGQLAEVSLRGSSETHVVVWKDGVPFASYPHVEGDLAERPELQNIPHELLFDPPSVKLPRHARRAPRRNA
jgi:hypothetical protein